jgi:L-threonylcarbamoyladenylate synthase
MARWSGETDLARIAEREADVMGTDFRRIHIIAHEEIPMANPFGRVAIIPHDPEAYARAIYAELHRSDQLDAALILVEALPSGEEWDAIQDRLTRASA